MKKLVTRKNHRGKKSIGFQLDADIKKARCELYLLLSGLCLLSDADLTSSTLASAADRLTYSLNLWRTTNNRISPSEMQAFCDAFEVLREFGFSERKWTHRHEMFEVGFRAERLVSSGVEALNVLIVEYSDEKVVMGDHIPAGSILFLVSTKHVLMLEDFLQSLKTVGRMIGNANDVFGEDLGELLL